MYIEQCNKCHFWDIGILFTHPKLEICEVGNFIDHASNGKLGPSLNGPIKKTMKSDSFIF